MQKQHYNSLFYLRIKKLIKICLILLSIVFVIGLVINIYIINNTQDCIISSKNPNIDTTNFIMVLGAGVNGDTPSNMLQERLDKAINVYNFKKSGAIIMSGDKSGDNYDEPGVMREYAIKNGLSSKDIIMDTKGFSTYESMYQAKNTYNASKLIIVTQKYHLYRSIYIARKMGIEAYGIAADGQFNYPPSLVIKNNSREFLARCKDYVFCIIKPDYSESN